MRRIRLGARPSRRDDLPGWYRATLALQAESGLSMAEFASRAGLSTWTLYEWRRRLAGDAAGGASPRLVEVEVASPVPGGGGHLAAVHLRSGHRIDVPADFHDAGLRRLIGVLESC